MSPDQIASIVTSIGGTIAILAKMRSYVTVEEYRTKVASLHQIINDQGKQIAVLQADQKRLEERTERK